MSARKPILCIGTLLFLSSAAALAAPCPNIMFVLDQSGSMAEDPNGGFGTSKWVLLQQAVHKVVMTYGDQLPMGVEFFTSSSSGDAACYNDTKIQVEPAHGTAMQILSEVDMRMPDSGTNTGEAIKRARVDPAMQDAKRAQYIVLITDGDPNCNSNDFTNAMYTVGEIKNAYGQPQPIHTFVVGFDGSGVNPANLDAMAKAGGDPIMGCTGNQGSRCYYSASSAQTLNDAIAAIVNQVIGGEFGTTMCDDSCYANGCDMGYVCVTDEFNTQPTCVPDPCQGVGPCAPGDYCRQGACVRACPNPCKTGQLCQDGNCVTDPCATANCMNGDVCNPQTGLCIANLCSGVMCKSPASCDVTTGKCADDQCRIITCPMGTTCKAGGNCEATAPTGTGGGGRRGAGCDMSHAENATGLAIGTGALLLLLLVARRRRARPA